MITRQGIKKFVKAMGLLAAVIVWSSNSHALTTYEVERKTGLGLMLGDPSGLSLKHWTGPTSAFDAGLSYSFGDYFTFFGDYLHHFPRLWSDWTGGGLNTDWVAYVGIGGVIFFDSSEGGRNRPFFRKQGDTNDSAIGVRVPFGTEFLPAAMPHFGAFLEIVPGIALVPSTHAFLQGVIGARYYF